MGGFSGLDTPTRLAHMLRLYMVSRGLEQREVAEDAGLSVHVLSRYLTGSHGISKEQLQRIIDWVCAKDEW